MAVTKLQISPVIVNGFENGFHQWIRRIFLVVVEAKNFFQNFFCFQSLDPLYRPVAGKPLVLEVLFWRWALLWRLPELLKPFLIV